MNKKTDRKVPEVRFKGFTDDWEQRKFKELYVKSNEKNDLSYSKKQVISVATMTWKSASQDSTDSYMRTYNVIKIGDIAFEGHKSKKYLFGRFVENTLGDGIVSHIFDVYSPVHKDNHDITFWKFYINSEQVMHGVLRKSTTSARMMHNLVNSDLKKQILYVPNINEENRIGKLLKKLDELITLQQKKLEQIQAFEKFLLKNLLAKEEYPTIRFKNFSGPWKLRRLGDLGTTTSGVGFPIAEQGGCEGIPFFKVSDMSSADNNMIMKTANNYVVDQQVKDNSWHPIIKIPAIIFAKVGAALMLNRKRLVLQPFLIDNNTMAYSVDSTWNEYFAIGLFKTINLPRYAQIGALPSFNAAEINNIKVRIPTKAEQDQIGNLLKGVWETINLQKQKIAYFESLKQFLLQKVFI